MELNEYQAKAHSTACHGGTLAYPIAALAEEAGEVCEVWAKYIGVDDTETSFTRDDTEESHLTKDDEQARAEIQPKLIDELGDVLWNVAELTYLLDVPLADINKYAHTGHTLKNVELSYYLHKLATSVGKLNGIWAKYIRKHDGMQPSTEEVRAMTPLMSGANIRGQMADQCIIIMHVLHNLFTRLRIDFNEVMTHNIEKLAARKAANTLGGKGSVERK